MILAAGAAAGKFLQYEGGAPTVAAQTAYGIEAEVEGYDEAYDPNSMLFMDFRRHHTGLWDGGARRWAVWDGENKRGDAGFKGTYAIWPSQRPLSSWLLHAVQGVLMEPYWAEEGAVPTGGQWLPRLSLVSVALLCSCWEQSLRPHLLLGSLPVSDGDLTLQHFCTLVNVNRFVLAWTDTICDQVWAAGSSLLGTAALTQLFPRWLNGGGNSCSIPCLLPFLCARAPDMAALMPMPCMLQA